MTEHTPPVAPLLDVRNLQVAFQTRQGLLAVTHDVCFSVMQGERIGLVGESGCGKSVTGLALMRLLPTDVARVSGQVLLQGKDLSQLSEHQMRAVRGSEMAMIFQEPMSALDPVFTIGEQIAEAFRAHFPSRAEEAIERAMHVLEQVGIALPRQRYYEYPHQLSGGMRQRVMIAMALICEPKLLIADEPTTALDVTVQAQILDLLRDLSERTGTALILITHDLGVVAEICTRMVTMYAGEVVEDAPVEDALLSPRHPYTSGLLRSLPHFSPRNAPLAFIPGRVPLPDAMPESCRFMARCAHAASPCRIEQILRPIDEHRRSVRCVRAQDLNLPGVSAHV
ncbi:ABC transporter ATP-binding protein [Hydrogenophaga sp.]|uniref:ABC transporter ATP-binding protein n=1 Tax=Hydrogenophaga sp. TaxID=1904254 RepID=UPI0025C40C9A|nr:ABC transporter ATP-binding protein [Hydrogenophaga sp.]MBT9465536.1 ABC transporter ATP-binding protein [Hydrogenophaga sp.]